MNEFIGIKMCWVTGKFKDWNRYYCRYPTLVCRLLFEAWIWLGPTISVLPCKRTEVGSRCRVAQTKEECGPKTPNCFLKSRYLSDLPPTPPSHLPIRIRPLVWVQEELKAWTDCSVFEDWHHGSWLQFRCKLVFLLRAVTILLLWCLSWVKCSPDARRGYPNGGSLKKGGNSQKNYYSKHIPPSAFLEIEVAFV